MEIFCVSLRCQDGYTGAQCEENVSATIGSTDMAVLSAIAALAILGIGQLTEIRVTNDAKA